MTAPVDKRAPGVAFVRLSQAEVGEVDAQLRPAVEALEEEGGYLPAIEQGMTIEEIREAIRQDIALALSSKPRRRYGEPAPGVIWELESASKRRKLRKGFERCLAYVEAGKAKIIGTFDADRITRDPDLHNMRIIGLGERKGLIIASDSGTYRLDKRAGRRAWREQTTRAADEAAKLTERALLWHAELAAKGGYHAGQPPYGYCRIRPVGKRGKPGYRPATLEIDESQAPSAKQVIADALAGRSLRAICLASDVWRNPTSLRKWLASPTIAGWRAHRGEIVRDDNGEPIQAWLGLATPDEHYLLVAKYEQRRASHARTSRQPGTARKHLLSGGRLRCPRCGHGWVGYTKPDGQRGYRCPSPPVGCGRGGSSLAPPLDELVCEAVCGVVEADAFAFESALDSAEQDTGRERELVDERRKWEANKARYKADYEAGPEDDGIDRHEFVRLTAKANAKIADIDRELGQLQGRRSRAGVSQHSVEELRQGLGIAEDQDPTKRWRLQDGQDILDVVLDHIEPQPARPGRRFDPFRFVPRWQEGVDQAKADAIWQEIAQRMWQASETTHCERGHPFDEANTYIKPNGARRCRECNREDMRRRRGTNLDRHLLAEQRTRRIQLEAKLRGRGWSFGRIAAEVGMGKSAVARDLAGVPSPWSPRSTPARSSAAERTQRIQREAKLRGRGWSLSEVAAEVGVSVGTVHRDLTGVPSA